MSIEHGGPSAEEMGLTNETVSRTLELTGDISRESILEASRKGTLVSFQSQEGEVIVHANRVTENGDELTIVGTVGGAGITGAPEGKLSYNTVTGRGQVTFKESDEVNPFA